ncbi:transcription elongation factor Spt6 [Sistotremastrum suecicum HHB10207 ss-3]|uniref:Transcription elongation factor Spt6 n=1 Tax=Sistotremastrum suecicum HHB10207 ss-3 TaxID=1314776 RepID=A0A166GUJ7_9AGAM|nr:transcription elongation factor Spt6 [Sistotremastrum suecicum HHB10207 ss-3]
MAGEPTTILSDDSSEEPEEDEEEERRVREGFIVDEDDEDEEEGSDEESSRRKRRRKRRRRTREEDEALEEDDLDLLEENTGRKVDRQRLTRLRRARDSESPGPASTGKGRVPARALDSGDESDHRRDVDHIWDEDDRLPAAGDRLDDEDVDMDDFIDDDMEEDEGLAEEEREERRRERKRVERERNRALGARPELTGIDATAWDEIHEVFGDGTDYDWALEEDEQPLDEELPKHDLKYADVFEPSEIRARMLTDDDDVIRMLDIPERMQLIGSTLSTSVTPAVDTSFSAENLDDAAHWVTLRLSERHEKDYFRPDGQFHQLLPQLIAAVRHAIEFLLIEHYEVPYIYVHKRDYISHFDPQNPGFRVEFLDRDDLWRIYSLSQKYQAFYQRLNSLHAVYARLQVSDQYFEDKLRPELDSVEAIADTTEWLGMKYKSKKKDNFDLEFYDDVEAEPRKRKLPSRISGYEVIKKTIISKLADDFGLKSHEIALNALSIGKSTKDFFPEDPDLPPLVHAEAFADPNNEKAEAPEYLLQQARLLISTELGKDPLLRREIRARFKEDATVTITPTEKGLNKIDEHHPYHNFKYLKTKPVKAMLDTPQFLNILAAEAEHLITVHIDLPPGPLHEFQSALMEGFTSDSFSDTVKAWNEQRALVVKEALEKYLLPIGIKWVREWLREEVEDSLAKRCALSFQQRVNMAGWKPYYGQTFARVIAVSWGKGDPLKDAITFVYMDENGHLREHLKVDNLTDTENTDIFKDLVKRREPDVIVIGGLSINTTKLSKDIKSLLMTEQTRLAMNGTPFDAPGGRSVPVQYVYDEVARLYQNSARAAEEFSALSPVAKYCVGLARFTQNPLNEYAALGHDLVALTLDDEVRQLVPEEKLLLSLERVLVNTVNDVGVDINRAVTDPYYQHLLPFICGLGPRKAQVIVQKIATLGGNLINRNQFVHGRIMTTKIFLNAAGFLRIPQTAEMKEASKGRNVDESEIADPLDDTRIHPEDYELARKMAADALDLDEEDFHDEHPSYVVSQIMQSPEKVRRLDELNLDDFAVNMYETNQDLKRHTLNAIRAELLDPFADRRPEFRLQTAWEVLTMLTSETERTLRVGLIVSVLVTRVKTNFVITRLDSGVEGLINTQYLAEPQPSSAEDVVKKGQTIAGVIIHLKMDLSNDEFSVELSSRQSDVGAGDLAFRRVHIDEEWYDINQADRDKELLLRKKRNENNQTRRVIKHPNFHNFNSSQAEQYLSKQQRGDVVVRPSSKGPDHLAVTWKVDDGLYQHIDVVEPNADLTQQTVGRQLIIEGGKYEFADLDELIVNHIQAMARRVEDLMSHEKFRRGSDDEIHDYLRNFILANPNKSIYCFSLNRKKPGHFNLVFLANKNSPVQTWPVRVTPEAYLLFDTGAPSVPELCDAFKYRHTHIQNSTALGGGGKTPYTGSRTPGYVTPGHRTPGRMSVRQPARTPNPHSAGPGSAAPAPYGTAPTYPGTPYGAYGQNNPSLNGLPQRPAGPPSMTPQRPLVTDTPSWGNPRPSW